MLASLVASINNGGTPSGTEVMHGPSFRGRNRTRHIWWLILIPFYKLVNG